jgi:hypothetical protein
MLLQFWRFQMSNPNPTASFPSSTREWFVEQKRKTGHANIGVMLYSGNAGPFDRKHLYVQINEVGVDYIEIGAASILPSKINIPFSALLYFCEGDKP